MLILSRKAGESFFIGDSIEVTVFEMHGDRIRIGIEAPANIPILRREIKETMDENVKASGTADKLKDLNDYMKRSGLSVSAPKLNE